MIGNQDVYEYFYTKFPNLEGEAKKKQFIETLNMNKDKVHFIMENGKITGAGFFVCLTDETLLKLKLKAINILDPVSMLELLKEKGENIHFLFMAAKGRKTILRGIREVIKKKQANTVSWFNQKLTKLNIFTLKGIVCK